MEYVLLFLISTVISWVSLLIIVPIAQKLADFALPPWPETLWKLAAVAGAINLVDVALGPVSLVLSWIVPPILFFFLMVKWFQIDFFGALVLIAVSWIIRMCLSTAILAAVLPAVIAHMKT
jgi:hypothetical protein